jgi:hypothetical protein
MDKMSQLKDAESTKNLEEMRTLYRLVYKDGDYGAWDDDIDRIREYAKFFGAEIESRKFNV